MKNSLIIIAILILSAVVQTVNAQSITSAQFKKLEWLLGKWERKNAKPGQSGFEQWQKVSPTKLIGKGLTLKGKDTVFVEELEISIQGKNIFYNVKLSGEKPVAFKLVHIDSQEFVFENPAHDFLKKIAYRRKGKNAIAVVSGGDQRLVYEFSRAKF